MRVTARLDVVLVPTAPEVPPERGHAFVAELVAAGVLAADGSPGPAVASGFRGTFARVRVDDPGQVTLWANLVGGFRPACPRTGAPVVEGFTAAVRALRASGDAQTSTFRCPACGEVHALDAVTVEPGGVAVGRWALALAQVDDPDTGLAPALAARWTALVGAYRRVVRRT